MLIVSFVSLVQVLYNYLFAFHGLFSLQILYAISCLIRNLAAAEDHFIRIHASAIFGSALLCDAGEQSALWSRAMYLGAALLSPDSASPTRITVLASALLPVCFSALSSSAVDTREGMLALLRAFVEYPAPGGRQVLREHQAALELLFANFDSIHTGDTVFRVDGNADSNFSSSAAAGSSSTVDAVEQSIIEDEEERLYAAEQRAHERTLLAAIIEALSSPELPFASAAAGTGSSSAAGGSSSAVLLLGPPHEHQATDYNTSPGHIANAE